MSELVEVNFTFLFLERCGWELGGAFWFEVHGVWVMTEVLYIYHASRDMQPPPDLENLISESPVANRCVLLICDLLRGHVHTDPGWSATSARGQVKKLKGKKG